MAETSTNNHGPEYYKRGSIETWDFIRDKDLSFHLGNAIKYIVRAGYKDSKKEDLEKAIHYLQNELENTNNRTEFKPKNITRTSPRIPIEFRDWEDTYPHGQGPSEEFDR